MSTYKVVSEDGLRMFIKGALSDREMSISQLAVRTQLDRSNLSEWINGKSGIKFGSLLRVCEALGIVVQFGS